MRIWTYVGALVSLAAVAYAGFLVLRTLTQGVDVPGYASLMIVVLLFGGINMLTLGIMGEYIGRVYTEVKARPLYLVRDRFGFDQTPSARDPETLEDRWSARSTTKWPTYKTGTGGSSGAGAS